MATADVNVNALTTVTVPTNVDSMVMVDRNTNEGRIIDYNTMANLIANKSKVLIVTSNNAITSLPYTLNSTNATNAADITADMVVINSTLETPSAQTSDWTANTSAGQAVISGSVASPGTKVTLYLAVKKS